MRRARRLHAWVLRGILLAEPLLAGCHNVAPPASPMPNAAAALDRARASSACGVAIQASSKIDHFSDQGRFRGDLLMFASAPDRIRMDVVSPFGVTLATLTSDGHAFALSDLREKRFFTGPASACNIARLTTVPLPGHVLVSLLRGQAPLVRHEPSAMRIAWSPRGYYVVTIPSTRAALEELHLAPHPDDVPKHWSVQRLRVLDVRVEQYGRVAWHAMLDEHAAAPMAAPRVDADGIDPVLAPSGPACTAELPRRVHVEMPEQDQDVRIRYEQVTWNPPLPDGTFLQPAPPGVDVSSVDCR
jgi:hypothetical protein